MVSLTGKQLKSVKQKQGGLDYLAHLKNPDDSRAKKGGQMCYESFKI